MTGHVEVQDPTPSVFQDEEAVQQSEGHARHGEEVEGDDHLAVILEKRQPALGGATAAPNTSQIPSHGSFGDDEAELLKLSVDLGGTPACILLRHPADERADFGGDLWPTAARAGPPTPVETKTGAVPANHGLRLHDDQQLGPAGPNLTEACPEEPVQPIQTGTGSFPLEDGDLLSEGEDLQGGVAATTEENAHHGEYGEDEFLHELTLLTWVTWSWQADGVGSQVADFKTSRGFVYAQLCGRVTPQPRT